jgi:hypothetical protein
VTSTNRTRRLIAAGAFAVAAVAAPFAAAALGSTGATDDVAGPACLAWFGNKEDGKCLSYSNGNGVNVGTPDFGFGNTDGNGPIGVTTGPLLPGTSFDDPIG